MFRKFLLIIAMVYVIIGYVYPCVILPVGQYEAKLSDTLSTSYEFGWNGRVKINTKTRKNDGESETTLVEGYYKLSGNKVIISIDEEFDDYDLRIEITSLHKVGEFKNSVAFIITIVVGVISFLLIVSIPKRRRRKKKDE